MEALHKFNMTTDGVIVNQIQPEEVDCEFCAARRKIQQQRLKTIQQKFGGQVIAEIPLQKYEVKGMDRLTEIGDILYGNHIEEVKALPMT